MNIYIHTYHTSIISVSYQYHTNINIILIYINIPDIHTRYTCIIQESTHFILCPSFYFKTEVPTISLSENMVEVPVSLVHEKVVEVATWSRSNCRSKERRLKLAWKHNMKTIQYSRHIWYYIYIWHSHIEQTYTTTYNFYISIYFKSIILSYWDVPLKSEIHPARCLKSKLWRSWNNCPRSWRTMANHGEPDWKKTTHGGNNTTFP